jgi:class 3 adenylate cyclase
MIYDEGDYFGRTVNIAARIASQAGADQVFIGEDAWREVTPDGFRFVEEGMFDLKGNLLAGEDLPGRSLRARLRGQTMGTLRGCRPPNMTTRPPRVTIRAGTRFRGSRPGRSGSS